MNTLTRTKAVLAGLSALSLLAISACSSESDASVNPDAPETSAAQEQSESTSGPVYDFSAVADQQSSDELRIEVPEQLIEAIGDNRGDLLVDSITARATEDTESQCAIEFTIDYADGTPELIEDEEFWDTDTDFNIDGGASDKSGFTEEFQRLGAIGHPTSDMGATNTLGTSVVETSCASSPEDYENAVSVPFRTFIDNEYGYNFRALATVDINVMASGDIHVVNGAVDGYYYSGDEHGWLNDSQTVDSQGNVIDS